MMRAFIALDLSFDVQRRLGELIRALSAGKRGVKWCHPEQIHLTLKFFSELPEERLPAVFSAVDVDAAGVLPFSMRVSGAGFFGPRGRIRIIWAGLEESTGALADLQRRLEAALEPLGFPREDRPFHPHLTLGRLRVPVDDPFLTGALKNQADFDGGPFLADRLVLYSSTLTPSGPIYRAVHTWPLGIRS